MRSVLLPVVGLLAALSFTASAADAPNLTGTWKVVADKAMVRLGTSPTQGRPEPQISTKTDQSWDVRIDAQEGRSFHGAVVGPTGKPQTLVGVFRVDGRRFHISTDTGGGDGEMVGDRFELCWMDAHPSLVAVDCAVYAK